jgi:hypothetical protein
MRRLGASIVALLLAGTPALGQQARPSPIAIDTDAAADRAVDENGVATGNLIFDALVTVGLGSHVEAVARPFVQRLTSGEWNKQIWVAELRYQRTGNIGMRVEGGLIPSPVGYANLLLRPHLNPTIALPSSLFTPLPAPERGAPRVDLLGAVYAYGVASTVAATHWDARAAVIDTSPLRPRRIFSPTNPPHFYNVVVGGGVTPFVGFRMGVTYTYGGWLRAGEAPGVTRDEDARILSIESEFAFRYTNIAGEWTHDRIETTGGDRTASGWFVQGQQTLTPRWFAAGRVEHMQAPALTAVTGAFDEQHFNGTEEIVGFRVNREITLRAGHRAREVFGRPGFTHSAEVSVVWWRRWF